MGFGEFGGLCKMVMDTGGRLIVGSHNRNEFVLINADDIGKVESPKIVHLVLISVFSLSFLVLSAFYALF